MNKILNFHFVNDQRWFETVIVLLRSKYNLIDIDTLNDYYNGGIDLRNACHITVDDGDQTFYDKIYPALKKYNIPASLYVSPKAIAEKTNYWFQEIYGYDKMLIKQIIAVYFGIPSGSLTKFALESVFKTLTIQQIQDILKLYREQTNSSKKQYQNITIDQLKEVDEYGLVKIGAHTMNHPILGNEDDQSSKYEITESVNQLANLLNHEINYFAYPNGIPGVDFTAREQATLRNSGIKLAFSTEAKNISINDNRMSIPRIGISSDENMFFLKAKLFIGSPWKSLKKLKVNGEYMERKKLNNSILRSS